MNVRHELPTTDIGTAGMSGDETLSGVELATGPRGYSWNFACEMIRLMRLNSAASLEARPTLTAWRRP